MYSISPAYVKHKTKNGKYFMILSRIKPRPGLWALTKKRERKKAKSKKKEGKNPLRRT